MDARWEAYVDAVAAGQAESTASNMAVLPLDRDAGPSTNVRNAVAALMRGLRTTLDDDGYAGVRLMAYRLPADPGDTVEIAVALPRSSATLHGMKAGRPPLQARRNAEGWMGLRHDDYIDIIENPFGGNDVEAWYGDLPDTPTHEGPVGSGSATGCHASWRGERIALRAGVTQTVMAVRIDVEDLVGSTPRSRERDDRLVGTALMRFYADLEASCAAEIRSTVSPLLAWVDDQNTVNLRYAARWKRAEEESSLRYAPTPASPHVIIPSDIQIVRGARLQEWSEAVLLSVHPSKPEPVGFRFHRPGPIMLASILINVICCSLVGWKWALGAVAFSMIMLVIGQVEHAIRANRLARPRSEPPSPGLMLETSFEDLRNLVRASIDADLMSSLEDAIASCRRLVDLSDGTTDQSVIETRMLIEHHLPGMTAAFRKSAHVANEDERAALARKFAKAVIEIGDHAEQARRRIVENAGGELDTQIGYLRGRMGDPQLAPVQERLA